MYLLTVPSGCFALARALPDSPVRKTWMSGPLKYFFPGFSCCKSARASMNVYLHLKMNKNVKIYEIFELIELIAMWIIFIHIAINSKNSNFHDLRVHFVQIGVFPPTRTCRVPRERQVHLKLDGHRAFVDSDFYLSRAKNRLFTIN